MARQLASSKKLERNEYIRSAASMHMSYREIQGFVSEKMGYKISFSTIRKVLDCTRKVDSRFDDFQDKCVAYLQSNEYEKLAKKARQLKYSQLCFEEWLVQDDKKDS